MTAHTIVAPVESPLAVWIPGFALAGSGWFEAAQTYDALRRLAGLPGTGVRLAPVLVLLDEPRTVPDPLWGPLIPDFERVWPEDLPEGYSNGFRFATPVIDLAAYHAYLRSSWEQQDDAAD